MANKNGQLREFGKFRLDAEKRILWFEKEPVSLALKEIELLSVLTENPGEVVTKEELLNRVWADSFVEESNLSRHVYVLRKTLKEFGAGDLIETVPRRGYRFKGETRTDSQIVIERRSVTTTLIEEVPDTKVETGPAKRSVLLTRRAVLGLAFVLLTAAGGIVVWRQKRAAVSTTIRSVAILPFNTLNAEKGDENDGLAITDLLITRLSNIREITVRPTSAVLNFAGGDSIAAGEKLNVDAVLEGTVFRSAGNVSVTARLLKVSDGTPIWAGQFEKTAGDKLALQNEISLQLVDALALSLNSDQKHQLTKRFTESTEALELYTRGRYQWNKRSTTALSEAERLFRNAIEKDPNFALAHVGLADTLVMRELTPSLSIQAANRALEIDPDLGEAHATLGFIKMFYEWKWEEAEAEFKKAIELNPNYATGHHWYATLLAIEGRHDLAKSEMHSALGINPLSQNFLADLGQIHYFAGEFKEAEEYCLRSLAIDPDFIFAHKYLQNIFIMEGEYEKAVEEQVRYGYYENPLARKENLETAVLDAKNRLRKTSAKQYLLEALIAAPKHPNHSYHNAVIYSLTGETEKALQNLERAYEGRAFMSAFVKPDPVFAALRNEPRYRDLLSKMDLAD